MIRGKITYHDPGVSTVGGVDFPEIRLNGTVDPFFTTAETCEEAAEIFLDAAQFEGTYRPQGKTPGIPGSERDGRFIVQVFDQGEPGRTEDPAFVTGDGSPSSSSEARTAPTPGAATSRAGTSR